MQGQQKSTNSAESFGKNWAGTVLMVLLAGLCVASLIRRPEVRQPAPHPANATDSPIAVTPQKSSSLNRAVIQEAMQKGTQYLRSRQSPAGDWEQVPAPTAGPAGSLNSGQWGFTSALVTWSLLKIESYQEPPLVMATDWLSKARQLSGTYAVAARMRVWSLLPAKGKELGRLKTNQKADGDLLVKGVRLTGKGADYGYDLANPGTGKSDRLATLFAARALGAVSRSRELNFAAPKEHWESLRAALLDEQSANGGWARRGSADANAGEAAVSSLMGADILQLASAALDISNGECNGNSALSDPDAGWKRVNEMGLEGALAPLELESGTPPSLQNLSSMILAEAALAAGVKDIGRTAWQPALITRLLASQNDDGSFGNPSSASPAVETALALLALSDAVTPVPIRKIDDQRPDWNQRPWDVKNLLAVQSHWMCDRPMTVQHVGLTSMADLDGARIAYVSGSGALRFSREQASILRQFIEEGGLVLGNADCGSNAFSESFEVLGKTLFPLYSFRELTQKDSVFSHPMFRPDKWRHFPKLHALSNGVRELMILIPNDDLAKQWQMSPAAVRQDDLEAGADIVQYTNPSSLYCFIESWYSHEIQDETVAQSTIKLARLHIGGNDDPEPGGWRRMKVVMHTTVGRNLAVTDVHLGGGPLNGFDVAHLTGTGAVHLTGAQRDALKGFVQAGGTLLIDAAGGSDAFAGAAEVEMNLVFGATAAQLAEPLKPDHEVYRITDPPISEVHFTRFSRPPLRGHLPQLCGIDIDGRVAVFFSREDLSAALTGDPPDSIGYDTVSATAIVRNVLLYAQRHRK